MVCLSSICVCVCRDEVGGVGGGGSRQPAFLSLLYHIVFVLITILAGGRCREGALTYAHNLLVGHEVTCFYGVLMHLSFLFLFCVISAPYHIIHP